MTTNKEEKKRVTTFVRAQSDAYAHCPSWVLSWPYRKQQLLKELLSYDADVMALQEVQSDHYEQFLRPKLEEVGYDSVYKQKSTEIFTASAYATDGCATFYKRSKFSFLKTYSLEFDKAADQLNVCNTDERDLARLKKDNVALITVLSYQPLASYDGSKGILCVANTHVHANPELADVKVLQTHTLIKGLERIQKSATALPMLVCGDFNSPPGSAAHQMVTRGSVDESHPERERDPMGLLVQLKMPHDLNLRSSYSALASVQPSQVNDEDDHHLSVFFSTLFVLILVCSFFFFFLAWTECEKQTPNESLVVEQQKRLDPHYGEPQFTNYTREFEGTLDYIFYSDDLLAPISLLELPSPEDLEREQIEDPPEPTMPNSRWASDHVAILAEFKFIS